MTLPAIAVSMGDPAGIGPELVVEVLGDPVVYERCRPLVIGDDRVIRDACRLLDARREGIDVEGPCPADTVFARARAGEFAGIVCMYHDQANIARKLLATWSGATIFLGLPVVCATTAHGTAFDIVGRGIADPRSLRAALDYAVALSLPPPAR